MILPAALKNALISSVVVEGVAHVPTEIVEVIREPRVVSSVVSAKAVRVPSSDRRIVVPPRSKRT